VGGVFPDKVKWKDIEKAALANLLEIQSTEFASVADYTYREVLGSEWLRAYFALRNRNLTQLHGIAPNQLRWHLARNMNDEIDALLHLAQFNFECYLADQTGARDQTAGPAGGSVLAQRLERLVGPTRSATALSTILQLNQVPDLAIAAGDDALMNRILRQSSSRECRQFRAWFHENVASDPAGAATAYVSALDLPAPASRTSTKALRFAALTIVPTVVGAALPEIGALISTGVGVTAGAADAFVLDRLINRFAGPASPKLMIDSLRSAFDERQSR
jgi:hypothetical protein